MAKINGVTGDMRQRAGAATVEHFDVLIVGAGICGICAAYYLRQQCPDISFVILED